jgi:tetratricopeptide (TPR) repeat protein
MELGQLDEALEYYLKSLQIYDSLGISIGVAIIQDNIGSLYYKQNQLDNALLYHQNALDIFESLKSVSRICYTQKNLGQVLLAQGNIKRAIGMFEASLIKAKEIGLKDAESDCNRLLSDCYVKLNDYPRAYGYLLTHIAIKDSILNSESIQKIEELQARYESEMKEQEINAINAKLKTQRLFLLLFLIFMVALVVWAALMFFENRRRKSALKNFELLRNHIFQNISQNLSNLEMVKKGFNLEGYFTAWWDARLQNRPERENHYFFHFML